MRIFASISVSRCSTHRSSSGISSTGTRSASEKPSRLPSTQRSVLRSRRYSSACCLRISGPIRRSSVVSDIITQRRRISTPYCFATSSGATVLPNDFDILRPCSSITKPSVITALNGATPARADRLQQRRLEPAAMLVGPFQIQVRRPRQPALLQHEGMGRAGLEPDIDDVHDLLVVVRIAVRPEEARRRRRIPRIRALRGERVDDPLRPRPDRATAPRSRFSTNTVIGTPQARWRLMHQSGRLATIEPIRLRPWSGTKCVASIAASAFSRIFSGPSMRTNHCGVARKISGALDRQECG